MVQIAQQLLYDCCFCKDRVCRTTSLKKSSLTGSTSPKQRQIDAFVSDYKNGVKNGTWQDGGFPARNTIYSVSKLQSMGM
jgi:hypothetical protein